MRSVTIYYSVSNLGPVSDPDPFHFGLPDPDQVHETDPVTDLGSL